MQLAGIAIILVGLGPWNPYQTGAGFPLYYPSAFLLPGLIVALVGAVLDPLIDRRLRARPSR